MENNQYYKIEENTIDNTSITTFAMVIKDSDEVALGVNIQTVIKDVSISSINVTSNFIKDADIVAFKKIEQSETSYEACSLDDKDDSVFYEIVYNEIVAEYNHGKMHTSETYEIFNTCEFLEQTRQENYKLLSNIATQIKNLDDNLQNIAQHLPDSYDDSSLVSSIDSLGHTLENSLEKLEGK